MIGLALGGVVVYTPVRSSHGLVNVRFESSGHAAGVKESVVAETGMTASEFKELLATAQQPSAHAYRQELRRKLFVENISGDSGKIVFFNDLFFYGLLPEAFEMDDAMTVGSQSITAALRNRD